MEALPELARGKVDQQVAHCSKGKQADSFSAAPHSIPRHQPQPTANQFRGCARANEPTTPSACTHTHAPIWRHTHASAHTKRARQLEKKQTRTTEPEDGIPELKCVKGRLVGSSLYSLYTKSHTLSLTQRSTRTSHSQCRVAPKQTQHRVLESQRTKGGGQLTQKSNMKLPTLQKSSGSVTSALLRHSSGYRLMYRLRSLLPAWSRILQVAHARHALCATRCCRGGQWHQMGCRL